MRQESVVRTYLQLGAGDFKAPENAPGIEVTRADPCPADLYRRLYADVGREHHWVDRLGWSDQQIEAHLANPGVSIWVFREAGELAGYFELVKHDQQSTEIGYFGLLPRFVGRGFGKSLLACAVRTAFEGGATRVWLHTCTLDHPAALPNYLARGFREYRRETYTIER